jgi:hypothetical protein
MQPAQQEIQAILEHPLNQAIPLHQAVFTA